MAFPLKTPLQNRAVVAPWMMVLMMAMGPLIATAQTDGDTLDLPLPHGNDLPGPVETPGGVSLDFPDVIDYGVDYDVETGQYVVRQRLGDTLDFRNPSYLTLDEFLEYNIDENLS